MSLFRRISLFLALPSRDRVAFLQAFLLLPLMRPALAVVGFRRMRSWAVGKENEGRSDPEAIEEALGVALRVLQAARHTVGRPLCLQRSLVLCRLLRGRGLDRSLHLGVDSKAASFSAHAWVECAGRPLGEPEDLEESFVRLLDAETS